MRVAAEPPTSGISTSQAIDPRPAMTMTVRTASCTCGQLRLTIEGDPLRVSICHCLACQQRTGSVLGVQARFPNDTLRVTGNASRYVRVGDDAGRPGHRRTMGRLPGRGGDAPLSPTDSPRGGRRVNGAMLRFPLTTAVRRAMRPTRGEDRAVRLQATPTRA